MNRTNSGAIAVGNTMSQARRDSEIMHALEQNDVTLLNKTLDGQSVLTDFWGIPGVHDSDILECHASEIKRYLQATQVCNLEVYS
ncbi:hypothetical protein KAR91_16645 [Candidatus Pacearchaeota archaeon]|nr:hypothetical protein [Candidatus Pacearchaeota archaeon]